VVIAQEGFQAVSFPIGGFDWGAPLQRPHSGDHRTRSLMGTPRRAGFHPHPGIGSEILLGDAGNDAALRASVRTILFIGDPRTTSV